ncbi:MAG: hypothetical protein VX156_05180, partial [Pseudomonadota bacterium]|nr:hypothetical protein [Pseudomonadota bacterium]
LHTGGAPGWYIHGSFDAAYSCDVRHRVDPDNASFVSMVAGSRLFQVVVGNTCVTSDFPVRT